MGFVKVARHRSKDVSLYRQGDVNFILNAEKDSFAQGFARVHGPSICAIAFRVRNAAFAYKRALSLGAWGVEGKVGPMELNIPAIKGIGDSLIYLVDRYGERGTIYDVDFEYLPGVERAPKGVGLTYIDHLTHNVHRGRMAEWADFYERLFNFREIRYFDIEGKLTGLKSQGDDQPLRQDPHPDQREHRRQVADPGVPVGLSRRGHPAHRAGHRRHLRDRRSAQDEGRAVPDRARHLLRAGRPRACPATARTWRGSPPTAS